MTAFPDLIRSDVRSWTDERFVERGDDYAEAGHRFEAAQVYRITAEVILAHYEDFADEGGELADEASAWHGRFSSLKAEVARAAETKHPERATDLYLDLAGDLIDARGRKNYAQAAEYLGRVKLLYHDVLNDPSQWSELIEMIREDYSNLPALQDELNKAGP